jgi:hypothetical protein
VFKIGDKVRVKDDADLDSVYLDRTFFVSPSGVIESVRCFDEDIVFMPFDSQYAQSINVSNTGSVAGAITVDITAGGTTYTKTLTATATPKATTNISQEVKSFATASGVTGNAHIKVVVNSPSNDIEVTGVYYAKADGDRVKTK